MAERDEMPFGKGQSHMGQRNHVLNGVHGLFNYIRQVAPIFMPAEKYDWMVCARWLCQLLPSLLHQLVSEGSRLMDLAYLW